VAPSSARLPSRFRPNWSGSFAGEISHSYTYRNPTPYAGKRVLVVGSGSSGRRQSNHPDAVIAATGYRTGLEPWAGHLGVLTADGVPIELSPSPAAEGLYFHGILTRPAFIGHVAKQSRALAKRIAGDDRR
jgi:hypothetical protein